MTDDELLDRLSIAFAPATIEPPPATIRALRDAVDASARPRRTHRTVRPRWAIPALAGTLVLGGSGVAFAASPTVNRAARQLAHSIGLPVDSPRLDDAQNRREQLAAALQTGDPAAIAAAAARLRDDLQHLDRQERNQVQQDADRLLQQADQLLHQADQRGSDSRQATASSAPSVPDSEKPADNTTTSANPTAPTTPPGDAGTNTADNHAQPDIPSASGASNS